MLFCRLSMFLLVCFLHRYASPFAAGDEGNAMVRSRLNKAHTLRTLPISTLSVYNIHVLERLMERLEIVSETFNPPMDSRCA